MQAIVLPLLVVWTVVIPLLVVGLRLRRASIADALAAPVVERVPRACEGRRRSRWATRPRRRTAGLL
jgi:hypothetical protein